MKFQVEIKFDVSSETVASNLVDVLLSILAKYEVPATAGPVKEVIDDGVISVYTDGGCDLKKGGLGAWAYVIRYPDGFVVENCGALMGTTNNRMELMAVIKALEEIEFGKPIRVVTDSEYVAKGVTVWSRNWVRNGWQTRDGKPVLNRDLWEHLLQLFQMHMVTFETVKGHSGHAQNERCDQLCTAAMLNAHKAILAGEPVDADGSAKQLVAT
jgi:Ribonuclease HI